jgi:hypothetical protein
MDNRRKYYEDGYKSFWDSSDNVFIAFDDRNCPYEAGSMQAFYWNNGWDRGMFDKDVITTGKTSTINIPS